MARPGNARHDRVMPPRPGRLSARVALRQPGFPAAVLLLLALSAATVLPAGAAGAAGAGREDPTKGVATVTVPQPPTVELAGLSRDDAGRYWFRADTIGSTSIRVDPGTGVGATAYRSALLAGSGWWLPNGDTGSPWIPLAWAAGATDATVSVGEIGPDGLTTNTASLSIFADASSPVATLEPLTVEQGELTLRWNDSDEAGSGIAARDVLVETAVASAAGCGAFTRSGGIALDPGPDDRGTLALGPPPTAGCLRVSLKLTDLVGHTSTAMSAPFRIAPAAGAAARGDAARSPAWTGRFNLYRPGSFVTQKTFKWCVAASVQMMVNIVRHRTDRTVRTQATMIEYAQRKDEGPYGEGGGTDVTGWITALRHFGAGKYRAVGSTTAAGALRIAATAMRQTGRPAGILVMEGRHAWVLHGFESRTDPRADRHPWIRAVRISGPLYPIQQRGGYDPRPNTRLSVRSLARYFTPSSVGALAGRYVVVIPTH